MRSYLQAVTVSALLGIFFIAFPVSANIDLDESFGSNGITLTSVGSGLDKAYSIVIQEDGKIVVAGSSVEGTQTTVALVRYTSDGLVDPEFLFSSGPVFRSLYEQVRIESVAVGTDGRIVLGGYVIKDGRKAGALVRIYGNGLVDESFGLNGTVLLYDEEGDTGFYDLQIETDGSITAVGFGSVDEVQTPLIARFGEDGVRDSSFGREGVSLDTRVVGSYQGMAKGFDGTVGVCGYAIGESGAKGLYLQKFLSDRSLDEGFGAGGTVLVFEDSGNIVANDLDVDSRGDVFVGGEFSSDDGTGEMVIAGFSADGKPLKQFGDDGILVHDIPNSSGAYSIKVVGDGSIVAAGFRKSESGSDVVMVRKEIVLDVEEPSTSDDETEYNHEETIKINALVVEDGASSDGPPSAEGELITTVLTGTDEEIRAIAVSGDGMIYSAGFSGDSEKSEIMVSRYVSEPRTTETEAAGASVSDYYSLSTAPVTAVTRTAALTGGQLLILAGDTGECLEECLESCEEDDDGCEETCEESCEIPSIVKRGVVYSVDPHPTYDTDADDDTDDGNDDEETDSDTTDSDTDDDTLETIVSENGLLDLKGYLVKSGQTDEGTGTGSYTSEINDITPQTGYYVRAYCELSDGTYLYGEEYYFKTDDACFIATAAFGSIDMFAVKLLRKFRDRYMMSSETGRIFVRGYYTLSPPLADMVQKSLFMRLSVVVMLLPAVIGSAFMLYVPLLLKLVCSTAFVFPAWSAYRRSPAGKRKGFSCSAAGV